MAPLKRILSLSALSQNVLYTSLNEAYMKVDVEDDVPGHITKLQNYFDGSPVSVLDNLAEEMLDYERIWGTTDETVEKMKREGLKKVKALEEKRKRIAIVPFTLQVLTNSGTRSLKISRKYDGELGIRQLNLVKKCLEKINFALNVKGIFTFLFEYK